MFEDASLADEAQRRYLHYALSVIQSRALPDVRDGLKPVQRRILYAMANELHLRPDAKYRKSAAVVGDVMGKFHPHGDTAIYDALARMAQSFSLRAPLVDGRGNFGSADGDAPAAMRYTECKLAPVAMELLSELGKKTVAFRPNFDGTKFEPVVLPARFPNLLVNGAQGIAVGMATSIPPHNLGEVTDACVALIDDPELPLKSILKFIKGPDFPTGGQLVSSRAEIQAVYETGQGSVRLRGEYKTEEPKKGNPLIVITSIPYAIERRAIVEKIAEVIIEKKLPILLDVRDESTDETRIVCEYKREADPALVMAYLYKNTPLAVNVQVNLTCLVPTAHPEIQAPERLDLGAMLRHFLRFRMEVVTKRLGFDLAEIQRRIHLLEGFATIFDALDETIRIIRKSDGKRDAAEKLIKRFSLDEEQVEAILEMRLYKLAQLEIRLIREELDEKRKEAARLNALLKSEAARWKLVRAELLETRTQLGDRRRTRVSSGDQEPQFDAEAFIVDEDQFVLLTQQGWLKRQREVKDVATTRVREGDAVMSVAHGSTKASIAFFSNFGVCFVCRIVDIPATTGYGDPIGKLFKLEDKERIVAMMSFDPRAMQVPPAIEGGEPEPPYAIAVTKDGYTSRFSLRGHREPSTRAGRKYMRISEGSEILYVGVASPDQIIGCASVASHVLLVNSDEVPVLSGPGKGVMLIKLSEGDALVGARLLFNDRDAFEVENESGKTFSIGPRKYDVSARAGKGHALFKRGSLVRFLMPEPAIPTVLEN